MNRRSICLDDLIITDTCTVLEALQAIEYCGLQGAMVCRGDKLVAIVSDADIRRHLLAGRDLTANIMEAANPSFTSVPPDTKPHEALALMAEGGFNFIPAVDERGHIVDIHSLHNTLVGRRSGSWAVIMAGGFGTRLGELTNALPKPMVPVGDRPILEHIVQHLVSFGIQRIFISVNYLGRMIEDHFGDGRRFHCQIDYLREEEPLGTGGALSLLPELPQSPLVVMNGDLMTAINIDRLLAFHRAGGFDGTICLRNHKVQVPFGVAEVDGGIIQRLVEKPALEYQINAGIYVLSPEMVARVPTGTFFPITELFNQALDAGVSVGGYHMQEPWRDVGVPAELAEAQSHLAAR